MKDFMKKVLISLVEATVCAAAEVFCVILKVRQPTS